MNFQPWIDYKQEQEVLPIDAPPCPSCRYWKPQRQYVTLENVGVVFDGVRLCHSTDMESDFSCYKERKEVVVP